MSNYVNISGAGGGDSSSSSRAPSEDSDTLQSKAMIAIVDLLGEGVIKGLATGDAKSIFCNDTPLQNEDGSYNFNGVTWDFRNGTFDQTPMAGFSDVESVFSEKVQVKKSSPHTVTVTNPNVDAVIVIASTPALICQDASSGDIHGASVEFQISVSADGGPFVIGRVGEAWRQETEVAVSMDGDNLVFTAPSESTGVSTMVATPENTTGKIVFQPQYFNYVTNKYVDFGSQQTVGEDSNAFLATGGMGTSTKVQVSTSLSRRMRLLIVSNTVAEIAADTVTYSDSGGN